VWGVVLFFVWKVLVHYFPSWEEDSISRVDSDAFEGAHLHDRRYSFKRPDEEHSVRQRAKSRSSFSHHGASPLHDNQGKDVGVVGAVTGSSGSNSRLVSSMSARRANPGGNSARRSGGAVFQPVGGNEERHGELPLDVNAAAAGPSAAQLAASASWPRGPVDPQAEANKALGSHARANDGGVEVIEELDELI
jgi:hypothetical protein